MGSDPIFWGVLLCALAGGILLGRVWQHYSDKAARRRWPARWNLSARPLFNVHERALYRELRAALPQHVVLAKVSLLRFCQSAEDKDTRAWWERLQTLHVSLLVCKPSGVVVAAIDIDSGAEYPSQRVQKLKEGVLEACRVRYVRCLPGQWPKANLLAAWVLGPVGQEQPSNPSLRRLKPDSLLDAGDQLALKLKERRAERAARWAESSFAQDSFFASDSRYDMASTMPPVLDDVVEYDEEPAPSRPAPPQR